MIRHEDRPFWIDVELHGAHRAGVDENRCERARGLGGRRHIYQVSPGIDAETGAPNRGGAVERQPPDRAVADQPLDRFGRGDIYLVVPPGDWSRANEIVENLDD